MRILFAGSPAIAVPSLNAVFDLEINGKRVTLAGILTNPDSRRRRKGEPEPTELSAAASKLNLIRHEMGQTSIIQLKPEKLDIQAREEVNTLSPDLLVCFAYGRIFGPRFLSLFPLGGINIHPSLLPKYRGASPIPAAILARDKETGICIQKLAPEMDNGDILASESFQLSGRETSSSLSEIMAEKAAILLRDLLLDFPARASKAKPQTGEVTYCCEIGKEAGFINWYKSAAEIDAQIRAFTPWPLSFTKFGEDLLFLLEAEVFEMGSGDRGSAETAAPGTVLGTDKEKGVLIQTGDGILAVSRLQRQAKKALDWKAFYNGERNFIGASLAYHS